MLREGMAFTTDDRWVLAAIVLALTVANNLLFDDMSIMQVLNQKLEYYHIQLPRKDSLGALDKQMLVMWA